MANKPKVNLIFYKGYGKNFKTLRDSKGFTQKQLYKEIHISDKSISLIEKEQREPTIEQINIYSNYFNVSLDFLTGRAQIANPTNQMISNYTGLSDESIIQLISLNNESHYWSRYIIDNILADPHFYIIVHALDELLRTKDHVLDNSSFKFPITKSMLLETVINKHFSIIIDHIKDAYKELGGTDHG